MDDLYTIKISHENEEKAVFTDQVNDFCALRYLINNQSHSTDWAIRYEHWKVEVINQGTGESEFWKPYAKINIK